VERPMRAFQKHENNPMHSSPPLLNQLVIGGIGGRSVPSPAGGLSEP
jgi:hypothetical protein